MIRTLFIFLLSIPSVMGANWYVSPTGTGNGTIGSPGDFWVATRHTNWAASITGGDTVWFRGGTYTNAYDQTGTNIWPRYDYFTNQCSGIITSNAHPTYAGPTWSMHFSGSSGNYVTWRSFTNEIAKIDGLWRMQEWVGAGAALADWHRFQDLELFWSKKGVVGDMSGAHTDGGSSVYNHKEWINCVIHDTGTVWDGNAGGTSVRGCIVWYTGQDSRSHILYTSNGPSLRGNIWMWVAGYLIQGGGPNEVMSSNIFMSAGETIGAATGMQVNYGGILTSNVFYERKSSASVNVKTGGSGDIFQANGNIFAAPTAVNFGSTAYTDRVMTNNVFFGQGAQAGTLWGNYTTNGTATIDYNGYYARSPLSVLFAKVAGAYTFSQWTNAFPQFDQHSSSSNSTLPPDSVRVFSNEDQSKRAHIAICNWSLADNVSVSVSGVLSVGDTYQLINAENYLAGPIKTGTYNGGSISVPMTNLTSAPILYAFTEAQSRPYGTSYPYGYDGFMTQPAPTTPEFGAFVLIGTASSAPIITVQPESQTVLNGTTVIFSVTATGPGSITYQWKKNSVDIDGQMGESLTLTNVQLSNAGDYSVVVSNLVGSTTSNIVMLTVYTTSAKIGNAAIGKGSF